MSAHFILSVVKLSADVRTLIQKEPKFRKLFRILHEATLDYDCLRSSLESIDLDDDDQNDEFFNMHYNILENRRRKIAEVSDAIKKQGLKVYMELMNEKKM